MAQHIFTGSGVPTSTPTGVGHHYVDVLNQVVYNSVGIASSADWVKTTQDVDSVNGQTGVVSLSKSDIGLGNVDNTSDVNKPISTATQNALNLKYDASNPNGFETPSQLNSRDTANRSRANHTGAQAASTISDFNEAAQDAIGSSLLDTASVDLSYNDAGNTISATVLPAGVDHNSLSNFVANKHIDHTTVNISAGSGLTGGGDISASRTLAVNLNYSEVNSVVPAITTSLTDVLLTSMTLTPAAGTYLVLFNCSHTNTNNNVIHTFSVYSNGVQVANSETGAFVHSAGNCGTHLSAITTVNGSQAIDVRWRVQSNTGTATNRTLRIIRIA